MSESISPYTLLMLKASEPHVDHRGETVHQVKVTFARKSKVVYIDVRTLEVEAKDIVESVIGFRVGMGISEFAGGLRNLADYLNTQQD